MSVRGGRMHTPLFPCLDRITHWSRYCFISWLFEEIPLSTFVFYNSRVSWDSWYIMGWSALIFSLHDHMKYPLDQWLLLWYLGGFSNVPPHKEESFRCFTLLELLVGLKAEACRKCCLPLSVSPLAGLNVKQSVIRLLRHCRLSFSSLFSSSLFKLISDAHYRDYAHRVLQRL